MSPTDSNRVKATQTSFAILECLRGRPSVGVTRLAEEVGISKSAVHKHLQTLSEMGYVERSGREYRLGMGFLALGIPLRNRMELYRVSRPEIDKVAVATGERVNLLVESNWQGVYVYTRRKDERDIGALRENDLVSLHEVAAGRAILAHLSEERLDAYLSHEGLSEQSDDVPDSLASSLQSIRERGLAFDRGGAETDRRSVAVPVLRPDGTPTGAIEITGPSSRVGGKRLEEDFSGLLLSVASNIETQLSTG